MVLSNFLSNINQAVDLVTGQYPGSSLYQVDGFSVQGSITDVLKVDCLRLLFRTRGGGIALLRSNACGQLGAIEYFPEPWLENRTIPWPISLDLAEAAHMVRQAGYEAPYEAMTLRWPLYPGVQEPFYIFRLKNQTFVFVGVYTKSMMIHP